VLPALEEHRPELLIVACGFDSCAWDSHARLMLHSVAYRRLTRALLAAADRVVFVHEGGYAPAYAPYCALAVLEELSGEATGVEDPFLPIFEGYGYQELQPHQAAVLDSLLAALP
jgi:acetoin utilization deacetylase AcuC-like enzyme